MLIKAPSLWGSVNQPMSDNPKEIRVLKDSSKSRQCGRQCRFRAAQEVGDAHRYIPINSPGQDIETCMTKQRRHKGTVFTQGIQKPCIRKASIVNSADALQATANSYSEREDSATMRCKAAFSNAGWNPETQKTLNTKL